MALTLSKLRRTRSGVYKIDDAWEGGDGAGNTNKGALKTDTPVV